MQSCTLLVVLLLSWGGIAVSSAATVSACEAEAGNAAAASQQMYDANGRFITLAVSDEPPAGDCTSVELPLSAVDVRWLALNELAPDTPPPRLILQGTFDANAVVVSEVIHDQQLPSEPGYLAFGEDLLPRLSHFAFGIEERASWEDGRFTCRSGHEIAGVVLHMDGRWPQLNGMALRFTAVVTGSAEFAISDARQEASGTPVLLGRIESADSRPVTMEQQLPENAAPWTSLTLLCPAGPAALQFTELSLQSPAVAAHETARAAWFWDPDLWLSTPQRIWQASKPELVNRIYITVPVNSSGSVDEPSRLSAFIRDAHSRGIDVWAVTGDRHDVLPGNLSALQSRIEAYVNFNESQPQEARLDGVQLDIEPYLLPGFALAPAYWRERYVQTVTAMHALLTQHMRLDLVVPVWWGNHPAFGSRLLDALALPRLSLTVMNYRTVLPQLRGGALPFLAWAEAGGNTVSMALETGTIGVFSSTEGQSERRRHYETDGDIGELWLIDLAGTSLLVMLDVPHAGLPGQPYRLATETEFDMGSITFARADTDWRVIAAQLEAEWSVWQSFAGLSIHGLDQTIQAER